MRIFISVLAAIGYVVALVPTFWVWRVAGARAKEKERTDPKTKKWLSFTAFMNIYFTAREKRVVYPMIWGGCALAGISEVTLTYLK